MFSSEIAGAVHQTEQHLYNCRFGLHLLQKLLTTNTDKNVVYSPFSIAAALGMLVAGAKSSTFDELKAVLGFIDEKEIFEEFAALQSGHNDGVKLNIANKVFVDEKFKLLGDYVKRLENNYKSSAENVNFREHHEKARCNINEWVASVTQNLIKDLLAEGSVDSGTLIVLVNAVYFKGLWDNEFSKQATTVREFFAKPSVATQVDMMHQNTDFSALEKPYLSIKLPYRNSDSAMYIILPPKGNPDIDSFVSGMTAAKLNEILTATYAAKQRDVILYLPKFTVEFSLSLVPVLKDVGVNIIFTDGADLSGMSATPVKVSDAIHKARIVVDEEGTEAAAATAFVGLGCCAPMETVPPLIFDVNRPFLYVVANRKTILFAGIVRNPKL